MATKRSKEIMLSRAKCLALEDQYIGITRKTSFPQLCPQCRTANTFWMGDICFGCGIKKRKAIP